MADVKWHSADIEDQSRRVMIVTGSTSGIGKEAALVLAGKGATVIIAARNLKKGAAVVDEIKAIYPSADVSTRLLDLSSLASIEAFSKSIICDYDRLDVLINNAGIMMCPHAETVDGFEIQIGTNHLGHYALTGHLLPLLRQTEAARLVVLSSIGHRVGRIDFSDLNWQKRKYNTNKAYGDSKLANLYFAYELIRLLGDAKDAPIVTMAHPGWTKTELQRHSGVISFLNNFFAQNVAMGVQPTLRAAMDKNAKSGDYYGPANLFEMHGHAIKVKSSPRSLDQDAAKTLWQLSQNLTGIDYQVSDQTAVVE